MAGARFWLVLFHLYSFYFNPKSRRPVEINLLFSPTENLLENTDGVLQLHQRSLGGGTLLPSIHTDARSPDDVIAF